MAQKRQRIIFSSTGSTRIICRRTRRLDLLRSQESRSRRLTRSRNSKYKRECMTRATAAARARTSTSSASKEQMSSTAVCGSSFATTPQREQFLSECEWPTASCAQTESVWRHDRGTDSQRQNVLLRVLSGKSPDQWRGARPAANDDSSSTDERPVGCRARRHFRWAVGSVWRSRGCSERIEYQPSCSCAVERQTPGWKLRDSYAADDFAGRCRRVHILLPGPLSGRPVQRKSRSEAIRSESIVRTVLSFE